MYIPVRPLGEGELVDFLKDLQNIIRKRKKMKDNPSSPPSVNACKIYHLSLPSSSSSYEKLTISYVRLLAVLKDCAWTLFSCRPLLDHYQSQWMFLIRESLEHRQTEVQMKQSVPASSLQFFVLVNPCTEQGGGCDQHPKNTITPSQEGKKH